MKKSPLRSIGKIGRANIEARKKIALICEEENLTTCEICLPGCMGTFGVAPAHKHKRVYYNGDIDMLSDINEWVVACQYCHTIIEDDKELTKQIFDELRP